MSDETNPVDTVSQTSTVSSPFKVISSNPSRFGNVYVVGAGGVGARLVPLLVKCLKPDHGLYIIDHDIVENRNIKRQHFRSSDVGRHKAEVLATRYRHADGPEITAICSTLQDYIISHGHRVENNQTSFSPSGTVIIGCVDNIETRILMRSIIKGGDNNNAYIDCGNTMKSGQVVLNVTIYGRISKNRLNFAGINYDKNLKKCKPLFTKDNSNHYINIDGFEVYANLIDPNFVDSTPNCAVRIDDQSIQANNWCANVAYNVFSNVWNGLPIYGSAWSFSTLTAQCQVSMFKSLIYDNYDGVSYMKCVTEPVIGPNQKLIEFV